MAKTVKTFDTGPGRLAGFSSYTLRSHHWVWPKSCSDHREEQLGAEQGFAGFRTLNPEPSLRT